MIAILQSLSTKLTSTAATSWFQSLGGRVYLDEAPANVSLPLCRYSVVDHAIQPSFNTAIIGFERITIEFEQFFPHSSGANVAAVSAEALDGLLNQAVLNPTGYDRVVLRAESRGVPTMEDDAVVVRSTYVGVGVRTSTQPITQ